MRISPLDALYIALIGLVVGAGLSKIIAPCLVEEPIMRGLVLGMCALVLVASGLALAKRNVNSAYVNVLTGVLGLALGFWSVPVPAECPPCVDVREIDGSAARWLDGDRPKRRIGCEFVVSGQTEAPGKPYLLGRDPYASPGSNWTIHAVGALSEAESGLSGGDWRLIAKMCAPKQGRRPYRFLVVVTDEQLPPRGQTFEHDDLRRVCASRQHLVEIDGDAEPAQIHRFDVGSLDERLAQIPGLVATVNLHYVGADNAEILWGEDDRGWEELHAPPGALVPVTHAYEQPGVKWIGVRVPGGVWPEAWTAVRVGAGPEGRAR